MRVKSVGIGSTNALLVQRGWMGTGFSTHTSGSVITKYKGAYNIVGNTLNFFTAPTGTRPAVVASDPDEQDWTGIQTHTTFQGRMFMRTGLTGTSTNTYSTNYIFDSIGDEFNGIGKTFTMKANGQNVSGFSTSKSLVLLNEIAQGPTQGSRINDFNLVENVGVTSIIWSGYGASISNDVNSGTVPVGGVIVSVGTTDGFGFQPLVSAGATAIVSGFGTVSSISIGNTGSGYRAGIATLDGTVREMSYSIGIRTNTNSIVSIGTVLISAGHVTGVVLDAPYAAGTGYTSTPTVTVAAPTGPSGETASAYATVENETVDSITIISSGSQYTSTPTITISNPNVSGGTTAVATASMQPIYYKINSSTPVISGITTLTLDTNLLNTVGVGSTAYFAHGSRIVASSHTFEYVGAGNTITMATPKRGGVTVQANEVYTEDGGLVLYTSTDQSGNFRIGDDLQINQNTGTISGRSFSKSLFNEMTPFILALS